MKGKIMVLFLAVTMILGWSSIVLAAEKDSQSNVVEEQFRKGEKEKRYVQNLNAEEATDFVYTINSYTKEVTITKYVGNSKKVIVPSSIEGRKVSCIGYHSFESCSELEEIIIPESVSTIENGAFFDCRKLESINLPNCLEYIRGYTFFNCSSLRDVSIPANVTGIGECAFAYCRNLKSLELPEGIVEIKERAFDGCSGVTSINIPNSVTGIEARVFSGWSSLKDLTIPFSVKYIAAAAFSDCSSLKNVSIPNSVKQIGSGAFRNCGSLTNVNIPNSVKQIGGGAFKDCGSLVNVSIPEGVTSLEENIFANCSSLTSINIPKELTSIKKGVFYNCSKLKDVKIPLDAVIIEDATFSGCTSLGSITIPESVVSIGREAFKNCNSLKDIKIPSKVTNIGDEAFGGCSGLGSITIPESVINIGAKAFNSCQNLKSISIPNGLHNIERDTFRACNSLKNIKIPSSVTTIGDSAFENCQSLENITIPESMTSIGDRAFRYCSGLKNIKLPSSITDIGWEAFKSCINLQNVIFTDSKVSIGENAFEACYSLKSIILPKGLKKVEGGLFRSCERLESVTIPASVTNISYGVFDGCIKLKKIIMQGNAPNLLDWLSSDYNYKLYIYIPKGATGYSGRNWNMYKTIYGDGVDHKVTYNANGGKNVPRSQKKTCGVGLVLSALEPVRTGYTFQGWGTSKTATKSTYKPGASYKTDKDLTLYAVWKANSYKVAFNKNGGSGSMSTVSRTYNKVSALPSNTFKRPGYKFNVWNTKADGTGTKYADKASVKNLTSVSGRTVTLYAQWVKGQKVTYNANGGKSSAASKTVYKGYSYGTLTTPARKGYTFAGWYTAKSGGNKVTSSTKVTKSSSHTLYAHWTKNKYTVKYVLNGGKNNSQNPSSYDITSADITLKNPSRTGYTFAGWYTNSSYKTKAARITKGSTGNKAFYAKWTANTYTIRYHKNGGTSGSMPDTKSCKYGTSYTLRGNAFKRTGYKFAGWATSASGAVVYQDKVGIRNLTSTNKAVKILYAKWTPVTYTINYDLNGGKNGGNPSTYKVSTSTITLKNPTKTGYTFKGWYADSGYKKKVTQIPKGSTGTKKLYAKWAANTYTIHYDGNGAAGGSVADTTGCKYGTIYKLRTNEFKRTGYTFAGWSSTPNGSVAFRDKASVKNLISTNGGTKKLYAKWTPNTYQVIFDGNGATAGSIEPMSCEYGKTYTLPENSYERYGWAFTGWNTNVDGSGIKYENFASVKNMTSKAGQTMNLYAQWKAIPTAINLPESEKTLCAGETYQLLPSIEIAQQIEIGIAYTSDNEKVATVDAGGLVTAVAPGEAVILCKTSDGTELSTSIVIHVLTPEVLPNSIHMEETAQLKTGESVQLTYSLLPDNVTDKSVEWMSSDEDVVTVDEEGRIYGIKPGTATVTVSIGDNMHAGCVVTVEDYSFALMKKVGEQFLPIGEGESQPITVNAAECDLYMQVEMGDELVQDSILGIYVVTEGAEEYRYMEIKWDESFEKLGEYWYFPLENAFVDQMGKGYIYYDFKLGNEQMIHAADVQESLTFSSDLQE